jgi:multiple sugar transport system substrate-binding protein
MGMNGMGEMSSMRRSGFRLTMLAAALSVAAACAPTPVKPTPALPTPISAGSPAGTTVVRWFVGLGKGNDPNQVSAEKAFVKSYNASQSAIAISLEIVPADVAYETLKAEIANGNAPDIVGPVGVRSRNGFGGDFLDLSSEINKNDYDMTHYPAAVVDLFRQGAEGQVGLPYLINPAFVFYNKTVFEKAGLPDLPKKVGDKWNGKDWTWDTLAGIAADLTVDAKGHKSTATNFDPTTIVRYGFDFQWSDARRTGSTFGPGTLLGPGNAATIPDAWTAAWTWYYNAMWKTHIAPTAKVVASPFMDSGSTVASGNVAMAVSWPWAISTYGNLDKSGQTTAKFTNWDIGVLPAYNGATTSPSDVDTFVITKDSQQPDAAFKAMAKIMADPALQTAYGGMPAATADQAAWFTQFDTYLAKIFPGNKVTWSVLQEMENYPAIPSQEVDLPNFQKVINLTSAFYTKMQTSGTLNLPNEIASLQTSIQRAFEQASLSANP